jgi:DNA (cytosine-5)-methyltransferase 1
MKTVTAANRGEMALVTPYLMTNTSGHPGRALVSPVPTVTTGDHHYLMAPTLVQTGYGERDGQAPRALDIERPLGTVVSGGKHALVAAFLTKFYGTSAHGAQIELPLPTVTTGGGKGGGHIGEVRAFLVKHYGSDGSPTSQQQTLFDPVHTVTTKARFGLVTIAGEDYAIADIGMRMLSPRELFAAQGFPGDYQIEIPFNGKPLTKTAQIELAGNSVCPDVARELVEANARPARRRVA